MLQARFLRFAVANGRAGDLPSSAHVPLIIFGIIPLINERLIPFVVLSTFLPVRRPLLLLPPLPNHDDGGINSSAMANVHALLTVRENGLRAKVGIVFDSLNANGRVGPTKGL